MREYRISIDSGIMSKTVSDRFVKSFLDLFVLDLLDDGPKHGYEIMRELKNRTGARIGAGTLYPLLYELEDQKSSPQAQPLVPSRSKTYPEALHLSGADRRYSDAVLISPRSVVTLVGSCGDRARLLGLATAGILSHARFHNACHQSRGQRSIGREAEGPLASLERLQFGGKLATDLGTCYEEAAMILKRAIIDEHPVVSKRGHLVADNLLCSGCSGLDGPP